jgi:hypothetical protein
MTSFPKFHKDEEFQISNAHSTLVVFQRSHQQEEDDQNGSESNDWFKIYNPPTSTKYSIL